MNNIFLRSRFYTIFGVIIAVMGFSYVLPVLFYVGLIFLGLFILAFTVDFIRLRKIAVDISISRKVNNPISLGDHQEIIYILENKSNSIVNILLRDELPDQLQQRKPIAEQILDKEETITISHPYRPTTRGRYDFGDIYIFLSSSIKIIDFRKKIEASEENKVYPSILQMKRFAMQIFSMTASLFGIRKIRRIGENDEFEHLRQYQQGDNIKSINWKATSRRNSLVVNQFQESRSQRIYCIIDKGRTMEMPFEKMSLLDYSINSALIISNIVLRKYDNIGLITLSKNVDCFIKANNKQKQLELILQQLYAQKTDFQESNFEMLYHTIRQKITQRSIVFIYTNIETKEDLDIRLPYLKAISKRHLLVLISFKNTSLIDISKRSAIDKKGIYNHTVAEKYMYQKAKLLDSLKQHGIQIIYTTPSELSISVINKYLEIKAKQIK